MKLKLVVVVFLFWSLVVLRSFKGYTQWCFDLCVDNGVGQTSDPLFLL